MVVDAPHLALYWVCMITPVTWAVFRWDKWCARRGARRVPERTLLRLAALGGILGAYLGMYAHTHRHKAGKESFKRPLRAIAACYIVGGSALLVGISHARALLHLLIR